MQFRFRLSDGAVGRRSWTVRLGFPRTAAATFGRGFAPLFCHEVEKRVNFVLDDGKKCLVNDFR